MLVAVMTTCCQKKELMKAVLTAQLRMLRELRKLRMLKVFFHFLDVTTVNAWHLYNMSGLEQMDLLHFKASAARALINAGSIKTRGRGRPSATPPRQHRAVSEAPPEIRFGSGNHRPQLTEAKHANRCQDAACTRRTKYICMQCLVALCPGCFAITMVDRKVK
ncbi:PiggyBac transposable element-derived protein 4 [Dissostichus eleginoides]|uniref:PiggyBac transposable element-derived protein 4 n=1 Tax=Dissostichus eleginoides TaxID=100907 RepID=A0AAD9CMM9_DISEL|nr:PiggyBac transposable element-derived protein 4 [Dissostichus eleginoides]